MRTILTILCAALTVGARATSEATLSLAHDSSWNITVSVSDMVNYEAVGYQCFIDLHDLAFDSGEYVDDLFALHLIPISFSSGTVKGAAGIDIFNGQQPTSDDGDLMILHCHATGSNPHANFRTSVRNEPNLMSDDNGAPPDVLHLEN